jgi:GNAT superfamily N-acetyltransferase
MITVRPLTPDLWPALEDLFGKHGACNGCWCMYWRLGSGYHRERELNKRDFQRRVDDGPPPGLLAFDGGLAVGWCQLTPRGELSWLNASRLFKPIDAVPVWALSCFYVRRAARSRGISEALIAAAVKTARRAGAPALEAYPVDTAVRGRTQNVFTGTVKSFERAGFTVVERRSPDRPIMRLDLKRQRPRAGGQSRQRARPARTARTVRPPR